MRWTRDAIEIPEASGQSARKGRPHLETVRVDGKQIQFSGVSGHAFADAEQAEAEGPLRGVEALAIVPNGQGQVPVFMNVQRHPHRVAIPMAGRVGQSLLVIL